MLVVFDCDGTLSDCSHRLHHISQPAKDWESFHAACTGDAPIYATINTLIAFRNAGAEVQIWTGRDDTQRSATQAWLMRHGIAQHLLTRMRSHGDHTEDHKLKRAWLDDLILRESRKPDLWFEDRGRVVRMVREAGIPCFQVADGEF